LVFEKNANFFAENCQKSHKIVIITSTPGHTDQSHLVVDEDGPEVRLDDVRLAHVADSEEEVEAAVDEADHGHLREGHRVRPFLEEVSSVTRLFRTKSGIRSTGFYVVT
jgi:hypothetical protein